jgi:hypothetical protein
MRVAGTIAHHDEAGLNAVTFGGRLAGHALRPGSYRVVAAPTDAARHTGPELRAAFRGTAG